MSDVAGGANNGTARLPFRSVDVSAFCCFALSANLQERSGLERNAGMLVRIHKVCSDTLCHGYVRFVVWPLVLAGAWPSRHRVGVHSGTRTRCFPFQSNEIASMRLSGSVPTQGARF